MSTVNNNKPVVVPNNPAPIDDTLKPGEVKPPASPGAAAGAKTLPPDLGGSAGADKVRATPKLPAPNMDLMSDLSTEDLMLFVEAKKEKNKEVRQENTKQVLNNAEQLRQTNQAARLEVMGTAVKNASTDLLGSMVKYAVKNPTQMLAFAVSIATAVATGIATGGASVPASLMALAGQAGPIFNGVLAGAGIDLKQLLSKTVEAVLVWAGVPESEAYKYADISASVLMLAADIGLSVLSNGQHRPNPALVGAVAGDVAKVLNFSIGGAEGIGATVTSLASVSIALGFGIAAGGASYGGIDKIWASAEKVGAEVVSGLQGGNLDVGKLLQEAGPFEDLLGELLKQINADSGNAATQAWAGMQTSYASISQYIENIMTPPPASNNRGYA